MSLMSKQANSPCLDEAFSMYPPANTLSLAMRKSLMRTYDGSCTETAVDALSSCSVTFWAEPERE